MSVDKWTEVQIRNEETQQLEMDDKQVKQAVRQLIKLKILLMTQHGARLTPVGKCRLHRSLTGKPAPEVVRVLGPMPVWPLAPGT